MDIHIKLKEALAEVERLKKENIQLKKELALKEIMTPENPLLFSTRINNQSSQVEKVALFMSLFRGREDVFAKRWVAKDGRSGYSPVCKNEWVGQLCDKSKVKCQDCSHRSYTPIAPQVIYDHLAGKSIVGVYPLFDSNCCYFLAIDFDKKQWQDDVMALIQTCKEFQMQFYIERSRSGNGAHVWFFFSEQVKASIARKFGMTLLSKAREKRFEIGMDSFDRMFPNQDTLSRGGFGNLIALPLQNQPRQNGNSVFINEDFQEFDDQWEYLSTIKKLAKKDILQVIETAGSFKDLKPAINEIPLPKEIHINLENGIHITIDKLPNTFIGSIQKLAVFSNPEFYKAQAKRHSTHRIPRMIDCTKIIGETLILPRGVLEGVQNLIRKHEISLTVSDNQQSGEPIDISFRGQLTSQQEDAVNAVSEFNNGVIAAETGFGKTVTAAAIIARHKVNTLVIVHRTHLMEQWKESLSRFLNIKVKDIGQIGGGKSKVSGKIDIATIQSLYRQGQLKPEVTIYGQVIVDECHHISAFSFEKVLKAIRAQKVYGLTATPVRKDGLHPIIFMQCGPIRYKTNTKTQSKIRPFKQTLVIRNTNFTTKETEIQSIYHALTFDQGRNKLIFNDVLQQLEAKRSPIILTERLEHISELLKKFKGFAKNIIVLSGAMKKNERKAALKALLDIPDNEERLLIATGKYIGEGFDDPRLDTLFLSMPISWKGTLQQYVGRLNRTHENKTEVKVFDYVDSRVPILTKMFEKRIVGYKALNYKTPDERKHDHEQMQLF